MGQLKILTVDEGHRTLEWPKSYSEAEVKAEFDRITRRFGLAYKVTEDGNEQIREFDPNAETIIVHGQLQGG